MIEKLVWLKGKTLSTLDQNKGFDVFQVNANAIIIRVHSTGRERRINKKEFERAWLNLTSRGVLTASEINKSGSRSSAFIVALFSKLEGVSYKLRPITLYYKSDL